MNSILNLRKLIAWHKTSAILLFLILPCLGLTQKQLFTRDDSAYVKDAEIKYKNELAQNNLKEASGYLNGIALKYWNHNDYPKAIEYYERSLELNGSLGNENGAAMIQSNLGMLYADLRKYEKSYEYFQKTLAARRYFNQKEGVIEALINSSVALNNLKRYDESITGLEEALTIAREIKNQDIMLEYLLKCYINLSETHEKAGNLAQSRHYYDFYRTFSEKRKEIDMTQLRSAVDAEKVLKELALTQEKIKDQELLKKQYELKIASNELSEFDSLNRKLFADLDKTQLEFLALKQKSEIDSLHSIQQQMQSTATIARERSIRNIMALAALSLVAVSFFIYRNYIQVKRSRKILAEKNDMIEKQNKELDSLNKIIARHNERMKKELDVGKEIQMSMLPNTYPATNRLDMYALLDPAREVGGDLYDFFMLDDDHLMFGIGDVSGKGVPAALFMAVTKTLFKTHGTKLMSPAKIMTIVNNDITAENEHSMFVSYFIGNLNIKTGSLTYSNAGHLYPIIKMHGKSELLKGLHGPVLGVLDHFDYKEDNVQLHPSDLLLLYTDGVTEAMNAVHDQYSEERLIQCVNQSEIANSKKLIEAILKDISVFRKQEEQSDDITMLALSISA